MTCIERSEGNRMDVGRYIRARRKSLGLTQQQLAEAVGCTDAAIRNYESNSRTLKGDTLEKMAEALDVAPSMLVDYGVNDARSLLSLVLQLESEFDLMPVQSSEGLAIGMAHNSETAPKLQAALMAWHRRLEALEAGEITLPEYESWKAGFEA